jgi:hypothetical protein
MLRHLEQVKHPKEPRSLRHRRSDVRQPEPLDRVHLNLTLVHPISTSHADANVWTRQKQIRLRTHLGVSLHSLHENPVAIRLVPNRITRSVLTDYSSRNAFCAGSFAAQISVSDHARAKKLARSNDI